MRNEAAARPAGASGGSESIDSQKSCLARRRDDTYSKKKRQLGTTSSERPKDHLIGGIPSEPPTLLKQLEWGQREPGTLSVHAR
jgi:hypothetical protein